MRHFLSLGPKYPPFPHPRGFAKKLIRTVGAEFDELKRVVSWKAFFALCAPESKSERPEFPQFPYCRFYLAKGTKITNDVEVKLGYMGMKVERAFRIMRQQRNEALDGLTSQVHLLRGVAFCPEHLNDFLSHHVVVECNKDEEMCMVTCACYLREAKANMSDTFLNLPVYKVLGPESSHKDWLSKEERWDQVINDVLFPRLPFLLENMMCVFLNACHFSRLPLSRLLVKSHNSLDLTSEGRWASRPLVGRANWATSSASVIMATVGQVISKLDSRDDPLSTPLPDTMDLLSRVRSQVEKLGTAHQLVLTNYDFYALYTRTSWRHVHEALNWWHQWCNDLSDDQLSCSSNYEGDVLSFIFQSVSLEDMQRMKTELPFQTHVYGCRKWGWWLLNFIFHHTVFCNTGVEVYHQSYALTMGANAAPLWAQLVLCSYKRPNHWHLHRCSGSWMMDWCYINSVSRS